MTDVARRLVGLSLGGSPAPWREIGFDVGPGGFAVGGVTFQVDPDAPRGVRSWALDPAVDGDVDGLPSGRVPPAGDGAHPNGALGLDHLVVTTSEPERTTRALAGIGMTPRRELRGLPERGETTFRFFLMGTSLLELVGPVGGDPHARFAGLAFVVRNLDGLADRLGDRLGEVHDAIQPGRRIASVPREIGLPVRVAFMTPRT